MRNPEEQGLALACLQLAANNWSGEQAPQIVADAARFFAFVQGEEPAGDLERRVAGIEKWAWGSGARPA